MTRAPISSPESIAEKSDLTLKMLCASVLSQPYSFHQVDGRLSKKMLSGAGSRHEGAKWGRVLAECQRQFSTLKSFTPKTIATALELPPLTKAAQYGSDIEPGMAFQFFFEAFGRAVEFEIATERMPGWLYVGMSSEQIVVESEKYRRECGLVQGQVGGDGEKEYEDYLFRLIDGTLPSPACTPFLAGLRRAIPAYNGGDYIVFGMLTGHGKSYFAQNQLIYNARNDVHTLLINLENTPKDVQKRLHRMVLGKEIPKRDETISQEFAKELKESWRATKSLLKSVCNPGRSLSAIVSTIRQAWADGRAKMVIVDYIQLVKIQGFAGPKAYELAEVSATFRALSLELDIPIIVLAMGKIDVAQRADKRLHEGDLRDCNSIVQDAPIFIAGYRPEKFGIKTWTDDRGAQFDYPQGYADFVIEKGRDTGSGLIECRFDHIRGFYDVSEQDITTNEIPEYNPAAGMSPNRAAIEDVPF